MEPSINEVVRREFTRAAPTFADRTAGRFDHMDVEAFVGEHAKGTILEVGVGTGNFLSLFAGRADVLVGVDLTAAMLHAAQTRHPAIRLVQGDGACLPLRRRSCDLVTTAQTLHHIRSPAPVLKEMRRAVRPEGRLLVVDQVATEKLEEAEAMNALDVLRDPSHAMCRPPSALKILVRSVGFEIEKEKVAESTETFSAWMNSVEFPAERIDVVRDFVATRGAETGMEWRHEEGEWLYTRRRVMLLARRAG